MNISLSTQDQGLQGAGGALAGQKAQGRSGGEGEAFTSTFREQMRTGEDASASGTENGSGKDRTGEAAADGKELPPGVQKLAAGEQQRPGADATEASGEDHDAATAERTTTDTALKLASDAGDTETGSADEDGPENDPEQDGTLLTGESRTSSPADADHAPVTIAMPVAGDGAGEAAQRGAGKGTETDATLRTGTGDPSIRGDRTRRPPAGEGSRNPAAAQSGKFPADAVDEQAVPAPGGKSDGKPDALLHSLQTAGATGRRRANGSGSGMTAGSGQSATVAKLPGAGANRDAVTASTKNFLSGLLQGAKAESGNADNTAFMLHPQQVLAPELEELHIASLNPALRTGDNISTEAPRGLLLNDTQPLQRPALNNFSLQSGLQAGSEGWSEDIGSKISWLSDNKIGKAEISLHPAELGALDITINNEDDRVTVSIVTRNEAAREVLENSLPRLAELLRGSGLALEQGSVSQHSASGGRDAEAGRNGGFAAMNGEAEGGEADTPPPRMRSATLHDGRIDHYV